MNHPVCPKEECLATTPHPHPALGEGLFGPRPDAQLGVPATQLALALTMIPCRCACGTAFEGLAFTPLKLGERERLRTCESCLDKREAEAIKRTEQIPKAKPTYRDAEPLNRGGCYDE